MTTTAPFVDAYHRDGFVELPNLPGDTPLDRILSVPAGLVITDILGHPGGVSQVRPAGGVDMEWVALDDDDGIEAWVSTGTRGSALFAPGSHLTHEVDEVQLWTPTPDTALLLAPGVYRRALDPTLDAVIVSIRNIHTSGHLGRPRYVSDGDLLAGWLFPQVGRD